MSGLGRDMIGGESLAVSCFRDRLLGRMNLKKTGKRLRVLDLGCGDGLEAAYFAALGYQVDAFDIEAHSKWPLLSRMWPGRIRFARADASDLKRLRGGYDLVFQKDMLHHVADPLSVLREMRRMTRPGGRMLVLECNRYNPIFYLHLTLLKGHEHFSRARFSGLLDDAKLPGWELKLIEARVWPLESLFFQKLVEKAQDFVEKMPFLRLFLCYHLALWTAPSIKIRKRK